MPLLSKAMCLMSRLNFIIRCFAGMMQVAQAAGGGTVHHAVSLLSALLALQRHPTSSCMTCVQHG